MPHVQGKYNNNVPMGLSYLPFFNNEFFFKLLGKPSLIYGFWSEMSLVDNGSVLVV